MTSEHKDVGISNSAFTTVAGYAALAGVCPLIPVPFVDDFIIARIHRRMYQVLCNSHEFYLSNDAAKTLTDKPSNVLAGAVKSVIFWPIKKIIRKLVYVLAIKSCADVAAAVFQEGWLLARTLEQEYVPREALASGDAATLKRLRDAIIRAMDVVDGSPLTQAMRSAFGVSRELIGPIVASITSIASKKSAPEEERIDAAEKSAGPLADRIQAELREHWSSTELDKALRQALDVKAKQLD